MYLPTILHATTMMRESRELIRIPIAVKLSPFFTAFGSLAVRLEAAGADGLVFFNRYYQPDVDIATLEPLTNLHLSTSAELLLRLRWLAILSEQVKISLRSPVACTVSWMESKRC
jgi:dihydroorotate dehydrogenase (fumarate)